MRREGEYKMRKNFGKREIKRKTLRNNEKMEKRERKLCSGEKLVVIKKKKKLLVIWIIEER